MPEAKNYDPQFLGSGKVWLTPSKSREDLIHVTVKSDSNDLYICTCEGYRYGNWCRHIKFVAESLEGDLDDFQVNL